MGYAILIKTTSPPMKNPKKLAKTNKNKIGRPLKIDDTILRKLLSAYRLGATDELACQYAGIAPSTLYETRKNHPAIADELDSYKHLIRKDAVKLIYKKIKQQDVESAKWWLERKYPFEFGNKPSTLVAIDQRSQSNYIEFVEAKEKEE